MVAWQSARVQFRGELRQRFTQSEPPAQPRRDEAMVRGVIGDETHVEAFIDKLVHSGITLQVGLAVGRLGSGSGKDAIVSLIPTPKNEGQEVAFVEGQSMAAKEIDKKKGSRGKSATPSLQIDMVWVAEHARQVAKMLVGGIGVVGLYVVASESTLKSSMALLWQTSKMVSLAVGASVKKSSPDDLLLLQFSYSPRRVLCRNCSFDSGFSTNSLRPCEWKSARTLSALRSVGCFYIFEICVPIYANDLSKKRLLDIISSAISAEASRLKSAIASSNGCLVTEDKVLIGDVDHEVELFSPFDSSAEVRNGEVTGLVILKGTVRSLTYGSSRDPLLRAITDLKADIVKSLKSRLEILIDEIDDGSRDAGADTEAMEVSSHPLQRVSDTEDFRCKLPRRLLIPWLDGLYFCDYLQEGESLQDISSRRKELLGVDEPLDESKILEHEGEVVYLNKRSFWDVTTKSTPETRAQKDITQQNKRRTILASTAPLTIGAKTIGLVSLLVLLVSIIVSYLVMNR